MANEFVELFFCLFVFYSVIIIFGLGTLLDSVDGLCYGLTGKLPLAHLSVWRKEKRLIRAIAREERRKAREERNK